MSAELATTTKVNPSEYGVENETAVQITTGLKPFLDERELLINQFNEIKDLPITKENIPTFRELRIKFQKNRTQGINKWHEKAKEIPLRMGQLIDAIKRSEVAVNETHEAFLENGEKHFENLEKQRVQKLHEERSGILLSFDVDSTHMKLGEMSEDVWKNYIAGVELQFNAKKEAERVAEAQRIEREEKERLHNERRNSIIGFAGLIKDFNFVKFGEMTEEAFNDLVAQTQKKADEIAESNRKIAEERDRLKKEAEEREAAMKAEQERHEAALKAEREKADAERKAIKEQQLKEREERESIERAEREKIEAENAKKLAEERAERERIEAELQAKKDAEARTEQERIAAEQAKLSMGDKQKMDELTTEMFSLATKYTFKSEKYKGAYKVIQAKLKELIDQNS